MSPRADYYRRRRVQLRKQHRCIRCGEFLADEGRQLCAGCLEEKKLKRANPEVEKAHVARRLSQIESIRSRLLDRFTRLA